MTWTLFIFLLGFSALELDSAVGDPIQDVRKNSR